MTLSFAGARLYSTPLGANGIVLTRRYMYRPEVEVGLYIDLHTHTYPNSDDSFLSPDELVEAAKGLGLDGVCITEHYYFWDPWDILALSKKHDFLALPGCEVNTDEGHVLVFGMEMYPGDSWGAKVAIVVPAQPSPLRDDKTSGWRLRAVARGEV